MQSLLSLSLTVRSLTLLAGGAPILTGPSWLRGRLQGGETTTFGFNNIKIMRQRNAVANTGCIDRIRALFGSL